MHLSKSCPREKKILRALWKSACRRGCLGWWPRAWLRTARSPSGRHSTAAWGKDSCSGTCSGTYFARVLGPMMASPGVMERIEDRTQYSGRQLGTYLCAHHSRLTRPLHLTQRCLSPGKKMTPRGKKGEGGEKGSLDVPPSPDQVFPCSGLRRSQSET